MGGSALSPPELVAKVDQADAGVEFSTNSHVGAIAVYSLIRDTAKGRAVCADDLREKMDTYRHLAVDETELARWVLFNLMVYVLALWGTHSNDEIGDDIWSQLPPLPSAAPRTTLQPTRERRQNCCGCWPNTMTTTPATGWRGTLRHRQTCLRSWPALTSAGYARESPAIVPLRVRSWLHSPAMPTAGSALPPRRHSTAEGTISCTSSSMPHRTGPIGCATASGRCPVCGGFLRDECEDDSVASVEAGGVADGTGASTSEPTGSGGTA